MDFYVYDPSAYYANEDESSFSAEPQIQFEFGASASAPQRLSGAAVSAAGPMMEATHSTAQAQRIANLHPPSNVNTRATLWMGLAVTTLVVTVRMRRYDPCYWAYAFSHPTSCLL
jgi:hypothetical protein